MDTLPSASTALRLPAELTIYTVGELHPQWLAWLAAAPPDAGVHAGDVDQVDAAGVQLLLALQHAIAQRGQRFAVQAPSPVLSSACDSLGLGAWLAQHRVEVAA
jgi:anti-anti-sigma regulatory factor